MSDTMTFEVLLDDAFERYLGDAPVEVDAITVAAQAISVRPRQTFGWLPATSTRRRQLAVVLVVGLLVLALAATALFIIGRLQQRPSLPLLSYRNELVAAPNLLVPRAFIEAITLRDGRVLVVGGDYPPTAEVFNPADGSVRATGPLVGAGNVSNGQMALLRDGRVLVLGWNNPGSNPTDAVVQLFDPETLEFRPAGPMVTPRQGGWVAALEDGRALVFGGLPIYRAGQQGDELDVEAFDPGTNTFSNVAELKHPIDDGYANVTPLADGRVAFLGRLTLDDPSASWAAPVLEIFDPRTNTFSETSQPMSGTNGFTIPVNGTSTLLADGRLLIIGEGVDQDGGATEGGAVLWDPSTDTFVSVAGAPTTPSTMVGLQDGRVLMIGPANGSTTRLLGAWTFDPRTGESAVVGPLSGCLPKPVRLIDGRVLLIGGMEDCDIHHPELGGQLAPAVPAMQIFE